LLFQIDRLVIYFQSNYEFILSIVLQNKPCY
jgi:hypothetical protein